MTTKWVIVIDCNSRGEAERTRDWLKYYSFGEDRVAIVQSEQEEESQGITSERKQIEEKTSEAKSD